MKPFNDDVSEDAVDAVAGGGGATIDPASGAQPNKGFAVSINKEAETVIDAEEFNVDDVMSFIDNNADLLKRSSNYLGLWHDGDDVYIDITTVVYNQAFALALAIDNDQQAIFDLERLQDIPVSVFEDYSDGIQSVAEAMSHDYQDDDQPNGYA